MNHIYIDHFRDNESVLKNFEKEIQTQHLDYQLLCDKKYFNNAIQWMMEDIEYSLHESKFVLIDSFYHYLMNNLEEIYEDKRFYIDKAIDYLRKSYNPEEAEKYPIYEETFSEMNFTLHTFLSSMKELEYKKEILKKENEILQTKKYLISVGLYQEDIYMDLS